MIQLNWPDLVKTGFQQVPVLQHIKNKITLQYKTKTITETTKQKQLHRHYRVEHFCGVSRVVYDIK